MEAHERQAAKAHLVAGMIQGRPWRDAAASAGVRTSRTAAHRLLQAVRLRGEEALRDGRHGHPAKLRAPVRSWLIAYCQGAPTATGREVQAALQAQFDLTVSTSHICRVR